MNAVILELTFALPKNPDLSLVTRINHRSGARTFTGVIGDTNFYVVGLRLRF